MSTTHEEIEDIASRSTETVVSLVKGIEDQDRLDAYLDAEIENGAREQVIGAINQRKQALKEACPRGCGEPVLDSFTVTDDFQIKHQNAIQYKTCVVIQDGTIEVVFHDEPDEAADSADRETTVAEEPVEAEEPADDEEADEETESVEDDDDPPDLSPPETGLYEKIKGEGSLTRASAKGFMASEYDHSPDETNEILEGFVETGVVEELTRGVYKAGED